MFQHGDTTREFATGGESRLFQNRARLGLQPRSAGRRLLSAWHWDQLYATTVVLTVVHAPDEIVDRYRSSGTTVDRVGWKLLDPRRPQAPNGLKGDQQIAHGNP